MDELRSIAEESLAKNYGWLEGFVPVRAKGCWMYDKQGKKYLDMVACYSALNFGHVNPVLVRAAQEQIQKGLLISPGFVLTEDKVMFAKELAEFCDMGDALVVPMVSGAESVETAMKTVRKWGYVKKGVPEDQAEIIFCENNFHGRTLAVITASTITQYKKNFGPLLPGIKTIPYGNAEALEAAITPNTVAFIVEPVQGEGGIVVPPFGYLDQVREICTARNVLLVFDEVQTGFGRTGKVFGCDWEDIRPDVFTFGKALGGGIVPISAVVGKKEVMEVLKPGDHGSTFGGNPLACHIARTVIRMMKETHPEKRAYKLGEYFQAMLRVEIQSRTPLIKEVRGRGLFIGVELDPKGPSGHDLCVALFKEGIITKETRDYVLRFSPPLTVTKKELDWALKKIAKVFRSL